MNKNLLLAFIIGLISLHTVAYKIKIINATDDTIVLDAEIRGYIKSSSNSFSTTKTTIKKDDSAVIEVGDRDSFFTGWIIFNENVTKIGKTTPQTNLPSIWTAVYGNLKELEEEGIDLINPVPGNLNGSTYVEIIRIFQQDGVLHFDVQHFYDRLSSKAFLQLPLK